LNKTKTATKKMAAEDLQLNDLIIDAIQDIKGKKVAKLDMRKIDDSPADYFVICQGDSTTQIKAIAGNIEKRVKEEMDIKPYHVEGMLGAKWVLVDYFTTVVHVFYHETRDQYDLEDLWSDAEFQFYEDVN
jgi:ribosome-associated protein